MELKYIAHNDTNKPTYMIVRNIVRQNVEATKSITSAFGTTGNELDEICRGIQHDIQKYPRINCGFLAHWYKVEVLGKSVLVYHTPNLRTKKLLCEVIQEGGEA